MLEKLEAALDAIAEKDLDAARKEMQKGKTILRHREFMGGDPGNIKFSLRESIVFWDQGLYSSSFVLNILHHGYLLPLTQILLRKQQICI